ncbi:MAG: ABC transporter permease [Bacteroidales bacterium]|nr:ABC transporter permease [Bacteroidales bacterium]
MSKIWILTKKELKTFFDSLIAYILLVLFLGFTGFFTWLPSGADIFFQGQATLNSFFTISYWSLFFFIPLITMRSLAEENRSGTIELLLTKPVTEWQVVFSKYLSCLLLIIIALALTIPYYITVASIGDVDHGAIISGYLGLILMSSAYIGIGIFASSISKNQIVAVLVSLSIGIFFHFITGILESSTTGFISGLFGFLSTGTHFESMSRGVIDTRDIIFFISLTAIGLISAQAVLGKRKIAD